MTVFPALLSFFTTILLWPVCESERTLGTPVQQQPTDTTEEQVVRTERRTVPSWPVDIVIQWSGPKYSDDIVGKLQLVDTRGHVLTLSESVIGPVVVLEKERVVASCEAQGGILAAPAPLFFSLTGQRTEGPKHPGFVRNCDRIQDSDLLLLHYNLLRSDGTPYNLIRVLNAVGTIVLDKEMSTAGEIELQYRGKTHRISISAPEFPG